MARQARNRSIREVISTGNASGSGILILAANGTGGILEAAEPLLLSRHLHGLDKRVRLLSLYGSNHRQKKNTGSLGKLIGWFVGNCSEFAQLCRVIPQYEITHIFPTSGKGLLTHLVLPIILGRFFGKRVLLSYDGSEQELLAGNINSFKMRLLASCDAVTVNSRGLSHGLQSRDINADFVYRMFDEDRLPRTEIVQVTPRILVALPLERFHSLPCVIKAFKLVKQKYPRAEMVISGQGRQARLLQSMIADERLTAVSIDTSGDEASFYEQLNQSDVLVNSSALDYVPASVLVAMAAGLPVVTTQHPSTSELIDDRTNGLFFKVNDHQALADRLIELVESPELVRTLARQGRQSASRHQWKHAESQWRRFYHT